MIAFVELEDRSTFEIYEPQPGQVILSGSVPAGASNPIAELDVSTYTLSELFQMMAPDEEIPVALLEAEARVEARRTLPLHDGPRAVELPRNVEDRSEVLGGGEGLVWKHSSDAWFEDEYCDKRRIFFYDATPFIWQVDFCRVNRTGNWSREFLGIYEANGAIYPYRGGLDFRMTHRYSGNSWVVAGTWRANEGELRWANTYSDKATGLDVWEIDVRFEALNATDDGFHYSIQTGRCYSGNC